ncbi:transcriptional regulator, LysR family (plasmid) [Rhizobium leguminosarum bv. trifolii WSM2304]|uniref:Transcriptional regulator, LysR family n=1 Tax=Rhizobium leguminosarum bv. trifolii (strain WSM2304) TaxID=395492 RepID=A0ABF7QYY2_RHILW|nr:LysR family transcriptional regulator [Rhizobium leguminosarum]ACI59544.1 transcriptional regulator, LysR family [Rhizobium leguminosarum bv. trifolii WSM2304]
MKTWAAAHLDELQALIAVQDHGSFAAAGRALTRHSTVVSKRVAGLEARLGVRLIERTTRMVRITDAGRRLAEEARNGLAIISEAEARASSDATEVSGHLRLAVPATFGRMWIAPALPSFLHAFPKLSVEIDFAEHYVDLVGQGYDAALRIGQLADSSIVARRLLDHRRVLCAAPEYLERFGVPRAPVDLERHACLEFTRLASFPAWRLSNAEGSETVVVRGRMRSNDGAALLEAAKAGIGIIGAGEWLTAGAVAEGDLCRVLPTWTLDSDGGIYLVRPSARFETAAFTAFSHWVTAIFTAGVPWLAAPAS